MSKIRKSQYRESATKLFAGDMAVARKALCEVLGVAEEHVTPDLGMLLHDRIGGNNEVEIEFPAIARRLKQALEIVREVLPGADLEYAGEFHDRVFDVDDDYEERDGAADDLRAAARTAVEAWGAKADGAAVIDVYDRLFGDD
jgi:hypothetical protein